MNYHAEKQRADALEAKLQRLRDGIRALAREYGNASAEMTALGDHETAELWSETHNRLCDLLGEG